MRIKSPDKWLLVAVLMIAALGFIILNDASNYYARQSTGTSYHYVWHQFLVGVVCGAPFILMAYGVSLKFLKKCSFLIYFGGLILLCLVFVPSLSLTVGGATRWIAISGITIQASEFAKFALVIFLSSILSRKIGKSDMEDFSRSWVPFAVITGLYSVLVLAEKDLKGAGIIFMIGFVLYFAAGAKMKHVFATVGMGIVIVTIGLLVPSGSYRLDRISTFLNSSQDTLGKSYQVTQSLITVGSGGFWGVGLGNSSQNKLFLPRPMDDSIFAIWAEETGFVGSVFLVFLYLIIAWRGYIISRRTQDSFSSLLAIGISFWIVMQAFLHILVAIGLFPNTGVTLPLISYGGTSFIASAMALALLLNISKSTVD